MSQETLHACVMSWVPCDLTQASISITSTPSEVGDQRQGYPLITDDETKVQVKYWPRVSTNKKRGSGLYLLATHPLVFCYSAAPSPVYQAGN